MSRSPASPHDANGPPAAIRPCLLFVAAFALNSTPHEVVHALVAWMLGFRSTVFQLWANPETAGATAGQLALIAASGPLFSLALGAVSLTLYRLNLRRKSSGLIFLMLAVVGIYSFLGPITAAAMGGDFNRALMVIGAPRPVLIALSLVGAVSLAGFMFLMGRELVRWAPASSSRLIAVSCTTLAPWLIGSGLLLLVYWPLPPILRSSMMTGSSFWIFAVVGAALGYSRAEPAVSRFSIPDIAILTVAVALVRVFARGVHFV